VFAIAAYLAGTDRLQALLAALTPVYSKTSSSGSSEAAYKPPTPIKINKYTPSIVAPAMPEGDKVEIFSWVDESGVRRFSQSRNDFDVSSLAVMQGEPVYISPDEGPPAYDGTPGRTVETKVFIDNDRVFIPVKLS